MIESIGKKTDSDEANAPLRGRKILVVDDEADALALIAAILKDNGATVIKASDGNAALELVRKELPDLMTLDLSMPGKNGVEVFTELRKDPDICQLPVCIVTGKPEMRKLIYEHGEIPPPEGYLDKPVNEEVLMRNVKKIFHLRECQTKRGT